MASINYADVNVDSNSGEYKVGFFSLKNGEEAIVRFAINSIDDLIEDTTDRIYNILNQQLIFYGDYDTAFNRELRDAVKYHVTDYFTD